MSDPAPWPELHAEELLGRLVDAGVDFVLIGGMARTLLGSPRVTKDIDISASRERANLERLGQVLAGLDARLRGVPPDLPLVLDAASLDRVELLTLETRLGWLDLVFAPAGSPAYEELRSRAEPVRVGERTIRVAAIEDLITMKQAAARPQDLADIDELERILRLRAEHERRSAP